MIDFDFFTIRGAYQFLTDSLRIESCKLRSILLRGEIDAYHHIRKMIGDSVRPEDVRLHLRHITTNTDECKSISEQGIFGIRDVLAMPNELTTLFKRCGISYDKNINAVLINGMSHPLQLVERYRSDFSLQPELDDFLITLAHDSYVNAFIHSDCMRRYSTIANCPEIVLLLERVVGCGNKWIEEWKSHASAYVIEFVAGLPQLCIANLLPGEGEGFLQKNTANDMEAAFNKLLFYSVQTCKGSCSEQYAFIPSSPGISPSSIISITPLRDFCSTSGVQEEPMCDNARPSCNVDKAKKAESELLVERYGY